MKRRLLHSSLISSLKSDDDSVTNEMGLMVAEREQKEISQLQFWSGRRPPTALLLMRQWMMTTLLLHSTMKLWRSCSCFEGTRCSSRCSLRHLPVLFIVIFNIVIYLLHNETSFLGRVECCCLWVRKCPPLKTERYSCTKILYIHWCAFESIPACFIVWKLI